MIQIGARVKLAFYPFCEGVVIESQVQLAMTPDLVATQYRVEWDNPTYGVSIWLSANDLRAIDGTREQVFGDEMIGGTHD